MAEPTWEAILSYAALGMIVGFGYYMSALLPWPGGPPPKFVGIALHVLRLLAAIAFFAYLASVGALPILAAFAGFLVGRVVAFRATGQDA